MNKINILKKILLVFLYFIPLLELRFFYNSYGTLLMVGLCYFCFFSFLWLDRKNKKHNYLFLGSFFLMVILFFLLHHFHCLKFTSLINTTYDGINEALYFLKMTVPFILIYLLSKFKYKRSEYEDLITTSLLFFSLVIIITNILGVSYGSYSGEIIKGNFFTWFQDGFSKYTFFNLGSIGYFYSANQLSAIYLLGLPFIIISFLKKTSIKKGFVIVLSTLTMFLIGTRTATYGIFIILGSVLIIYFINSLLNKEKLKGKGIIFIVLLISIFLLLYPYSIVVNRNEVQEQIEITDIALPESSETSTSPLEKELTREDKILYIKDNYEEKRILPLFIISRYPYQNDPDFWYDILQLDASYRTNYRFLEQAIAKRVVSINNNKLDKYLGIGYNRMQNIFNIEKDFVMQYYSVGILGTVILLWFYLYYLVKGGILIIKNKGIKMEYALTVGFSLCLFFITAYQSGNLLNSLYTTIPCSILFGLLYEETKKDIN